MKAAMSSQSIILWMDFFNFEQCVLTASQVNGLISGGDSEVLEEPAVVSTFQLWDF